MRISELSRVTGVPVPTIKFYLREGLLPPGTPTAPNQARYDQAHVQRLRLIRALIEVGRLPVARVGGVLEQLADETLPTHRMLGVVHRALAPDVDAHENAEDDVQRARADVDRFIVERGWQVLPDAPARAALADTLVALRRLGRDVGPEVFTPYADAADRIANHELQRIPADVAPAQAAEGVVIGTVLYEAALVALRRMAQEHHSAKRFGGPSDTGR